MKLVAAFSALSRFSANGSGGAHRVRSAVRWVSPTGHEPLVSAYAGGMAMTAWASFVPCQPVLPSMAARRKGVVVNVASVWASRSGAGPGGVHRRNLKVLGLGRPAGS